MKNYFPWLTLCFAIGIWLGEHARLPLLIAIFLFVVAVSVGFFTDKPQMKKIAFLAVFFVLGTLWASADVGLNVAPLKLGQPLRTTLVFRVTDIPRVSDFGFTASAEVIDGVLKGQNVVIKAKYGDKEKVAVQRGDILKAKGDLNYIEGPRNPGEFDYQKYSHIHGKDYQFTFPAQRVEKLGYKEANIIIRLSDYLRQKAVNTALSFGSGQAPAVFAAMIDGDKQYINEDNLTLFQNLGLMHLFAISGLNVGIIVIAVLFITRRMKLKPLLELILLSTILVVYAGVAGFSVSVVRAVIIVLLYSFAKVFSKETTALTAISLAGFLILAFNPRYIDDVGFLLTFGCVLGLIFLEEIFSQATGDKIWGMLFAPICAQIAVLPILISNFHVFGWGQLLIAIPSAILSFPIVLTAFLTIVFSPFLMLFAQANTLCGIISAKVLIFISEQVNKLPFAFGHFAEPSVWQTTLFYLVLLTVFLLFYFGKLSAKKAALFLILLPLILLIPNKGEGVYVTFIDVGQGDAILLELPDNRNLLIDGGGEASFKQEEKQVNSYDVGMKIVVPVLFSKGIDHLDYVILTHPHADHSEGLHAVLKSVDVGTLIMSPYKNELSRGLEQEAASRNIKSVVLQGGSSIHLGDVAIEVLGPLKKYLHTRSDANNSSLVLKLTYGTNSVVLTGDIEEDAMRDIANNTQLSKTTFLKIPHHGSKYSLERAFLDRVKPAIAVVSVGKNNLFGHPSSEVLSYWDSRKTLLLRTDEDGAVEINVTKNDSVIKTYLSKKKLRVLQK